DTYLYVSEGNSLRLINLSTREVTTRAGTNAWPGGMDGAGAGPLLTQAVGVVFANNAIYTADTLNNNIRQAVCGADDPVDPVARPRGNPDGPVTGSDFLDLSWSLPASGLSPTGYDWAIKGDPFTASDTATASALPRGSSDPITLHVRSRACNPEV